MDERSQHWCSKCQKEIPINDYVRYKQNDEKFCWNCAKLDSTEEEIPDDKSNTYLNIRKAKTVNCYMMSPNPKLLQSHSFSDEKEIVSSIKQELKHRFGRIEANIPTMISDGSELQYPLQDYFAELQVEEKDMLGMCSNERIIRLNEIFHTMSDEGVRIKRRILITGDAGFGKSTLTRKLCYDWATLEPPNYLSDFELVASIPLRNVGNEPIYLSILKEMYSERYGGIQSADILKGLQILIILDGIDEIGERSNLLNFLKNPLEKCSQNSAVIATSRPYAVKDIHYLFDRRVSILGFSEGSQKKYIGKILPALKAEGLVRRIKSDSFLHDASNCPLILHLICCVYGGDEKSIISSRTELYTQIFNLLIKRYSRKNGANNICKRLKQTPFLEDKIFFSLGEIAITWLETSHKRLTEDILKEKFKEEEEIEFILGLGILLAIPVISNMRVVMVYEFLHRTFAEFLFAIYFSNPASKSIPERSFSNFSWYKNSRSYLCDGFLPELLGENLVNEPLFCNTIKEFSLTLPELHKIIYEAQLKGKSLEQFCSWIEVIKFRIEDKQLLFQLSVPNLREITIFLKMKNYFSYQKHEAWNFIENILVKFKSCNTVAVQCLVLPWAEICCSNDTNVIIRFINTEILMTNLISVDIFMRTRKRDFTLYISADSLNLGYSSFKQYTENVCTKTVDTAENHFYSSQNFFGILNSKKVNHVGLLPDKLYVPGPKNNRSPYLQFRWRIGNVVIKHDTVVEGRWQNIIPVLIVSDGEYRILTEEPFFHDRALQVVDFIKNRYPNLKTPRKFGHVYQTEFFQRFKKFHDETEDSLTQVKMIDTALFTAPLHGNRTCTLI